ncbi:uncharacterized protein LOC127812638 [Diospyros lotus]|uniref:uncharacterized protein LOC127812638 n=1 Tax=Diospyros lotus TaxID=55363 RepID=UPI00225A27ED|nr:uncharacterized protein LOC127812638 [Diospyros lotus]
MDSVQPEKPAPEDNLQRRNGNEVKEKGRSDASASTGHDSTITRTGQGYWTLSMGKKKSSFKAEDDDDDDSSGSSSSESEEDEKEVVGPKQKLKWEMTISKKRVDGRSAKRE